VRVVAGGVAVVIVAAAVGSYWAMTPRAQSAGLDPEVHLVAEQLGVSPHEAAEIIEVQGLFADVATVVWEAYPEEYIGSQWHGTSGTITVTDDVVDAVVELTKDSPVPVAIIGSAGPGSTELSRLASEAIEKLRGVLDDNYSLGVDPTTNTVTIEVYSESPDDVDLDRLKGDVEERLGDGVTVKISVVEGQRLAAY